MFHLRTSDGYTATLTLVAYRVAHAESLPALPISGRQSLAACQSNADTDAVVPFSYSLTNTTTNFSAPLTLDIHQASSSVLFADVEYGDGTTTCVNGNEDNLLAATWSPLSAGASGSGDFYLVLYDYYSPSHPKGDAARLKGACVVANVKRVGDGLFARSGKPGGYMGSPDAYAGLVPRAQCETTGG